MSYSVLTYSFMTLLFAGAAGDCCLSQMNWKPSMFTVINILKMKFVKFVLKVQ